MRHAYSRSAFRQPGTLVRRRIAWHPGSCQTLSLKLLLPRRSATARQQHPLGEPRVAKLGAARSIRCKRAPVLRLRGSTIPLQISPSGNERRYPLPIITLFLPCCPDSLLLLRSHPWSVQGTPTPCHITHLQTTHCASYCQTQSRTRPTIVARLGGIFSRLRCVKLRLAKCALPNDGHGSEIFRWHRENSRPRFVEFVCFGPSGCGIWPEFEA